MAGSADFLKTRQVFASMARGVCCEGSMLRATPPPMRNLRPGSDFSQVGFGQSPGALGRLPPGLGSGFSISTIRPSSVPLGLRSRPGRSLPLPLPAVP